MKGIADCGLHPPDREREGGVQGKTTMEEANGSDEGTILDTQQRNEDLNKSKEIEKKKCMVNKERETGEEEMRRPDEANMAGQNKENEETQPKYGRKYTKELTWLIETSNTSGITAMDIIQAINEEIGLGKLLAVRNRKNKDFEVTLINETECEKLEHGLIIKGRLYETRSLGNNEMTVSFLNLPAYIEDQVILQKLVRWGVVPILPVKRRYYPGTLIADGTRFLRVRFPKQITSLPYSTQIETVEGYQYFRVIHDGQVKMCRLCSSTDHIMRDCPKMTCRECLEQGHYARHCRALRCPECKQALIRCICADRREECQNKSQEEEEDAHETGQKTTEPKQQEKMDMQQKSEKEQMDTDQQRQKEEDTDKSFKKTERKQDKKENTEGVQTEQQEWTDEYGEENEDEDETSDMDMQGGEEQNKQGKRTGVLKRKTKTIPNIKRVLERQKKRREEEKERRIGRGSKSKEKLHMRTDE